MPASRAVSGGVTGVYFRIVDTSFRGFVFQYEIESAPALLRHLLAEPFGFQHPGDVEVLYSYPVVGADLFPYAAVLLGQMVAFLDTRPRTLDGSGQFPLRS